MKHLQISQVTLNVNHLDKMSLFYQQVIGLALLASEKNSVVLGIKETNTPLVTLQAVTTPFAFETGLYHTAFLVPNRVDLTKAIRRFDKENYPLEGASDHGYSEALYLQDPEGNGIEVYHDKPYEVWDVRDNGEIIGMTEPIDYQGIMSLTSEVSESFPVGTVIGHVHLAVANLKEETAFFNSLLDFTVTTELGNTAAFYGIDGYHHQFAGNIWQLRQQVPYDATRPGLAKVSLTVSSDYLEKIKAQTKSTNFFVSESPTRLSLKTLSGVPMDFAIAD